MSHKGKCPISLAREMTINVDPNGATWMVSLTDGNGRPVEHRTTRESREKAVGLARIIRGLFCGYYRGITIRVSGKTLR